MDSLDLQTQLEKHHSASFGWAISCCHRDFQEAESVLQNVYLKILEGKARYDGKSEFKTWLFAVIRITALDARRWHFLNKLRLSKYKENVKHKIKVYDYDEKIYHSEIQVLFQDLLSTLPSKQREVLQLVFYHDLSLQEAAEVMEVSLGTARTHYDRGKKRLREWIEEKGIKINESELGRRENQAAI